jgi:hypothetical protein
LSVEIFDPKAAVQSKSGRFSARRESHEKTTVDIESFTTRS